MRLYGRGGSLILRLYRKAGPPRYTIDVDFSVSGVSSREICEILKKAMRIDLDDGFVFTSITACPMQRHLPYGGERYELDWRFFSKHGARKLKIDACAGDIVHPKVVTSSEAFLMPIEAENIQLKIYPKEFIFAEKLETIARFKTGNTRCKDFLDIWLLIQSGISLTDLQKALQACFMHRGTDLSTSRIAEIMCDEFFQSRLETARQRNFSHLQVPNIKEVITDIITLLEMLEL